MDVPSIQPDEIKKIWQAIQQLQSNTAVLDHFHNGFDSSRVYWGDINLKKIYLEHTIFGTNAATAANYGVFFIAPQAVQVTGFREVHQTLGTDGGAVTVTLEKLTSGQAPDAGGVLLDTALSLKTTINTVQTGTLITTTTANLSLAKNDRLCLKDAGVLTSVANVTVLVELTIV